MSKHAKYRCAPARPISRNSRLRQRRGNVLVMAALLMVGMMGLLAFAVDLGVLCVARSDAQRAADAAALAAGWEFTNEARLQGNHAAAYQFMRDHAVLYGQTNTVIHSGTIVQANNENQTDGDIVIGRLDNPGDWSQDLDTGTPTLYNAVKVRIRRLSDRDSSIGLYFSRVFGINGSDITAEATAIFNDRIDGFRVTEETGNSSLLPFVILVDAWHDQVLNANGDDQWTFNGLAGPHQASDGIYEINMFPGGGANGNGNGNGNGSNQITPGNFGTVDIGGSNNSTSHLRDLILYGPTEGDLAYHGGQLAVDAVTGTLPMGGDTGMSVGMKSAIDQIVGKPRTIMLYSTVGGNGNNTEFTVVGFAGVRIVDYKLTGGNKYIRVQPAYVTDASAITGTSGESYFVGQPVHLVR